MSDINTILKYIPAGIPPQGVKSNLINPVSRGDASKISIYLLLPLMMVFLLLRLYARSFIQRSFGADDILAIFSALCVAGYCGILIYLANGPGGEHIWDIPVSRITAEFMKANLAAQCVYALAAISIKCTLLVLYLRIFRPARNGTIILIGIAFVIASHIAVSIAQIEILVPKPGRSWFVTGSSDVQVKATKLVAAQGVISVVTDFFVLCIPLELVAGLHMPWVRKLGVGAIFLTGLMASVCSLIGTVLRFRLRHTSDMFWDSVPVYILTVVELNFGVICSCMPVLPILLKHITKTETYRRSVSAILNFRYNSNNSSGEHYDSKENSKEPDRPQNIQLAIPRPTMTGLRTFIGGAKKSQVLPSFRYEQFSALDSVNDDYHVQLKVATRYS